jgi:hypothetical protein
VECKEGVGSKEEVVSEEQRPVGGKEVEKEGRKGIDEGRELGFS